MCASSRKQIRQMPNLRRTECGLPQRRHRVYARVLNFAGRAALITIDFFAITAPPQLLDQDWRNGMPISVSNARASSSDCAVVTMTTSIPRTLSILS